MAKAIVNLYASHSYETISEKYLGGIASIFAENISYKSMKNWLGFEMFL